MPFVGSIALRSAFSAEDRAEFYKQLESFVTKGVAIKEAIQLMEIKYQPKPELASMYIITKKIRESIEDSLNISQALKNIVPDDEIFILLAGEEAKDEESRAKSFRNASVSSLDKKELSEIVKGALTYPSVLVVVGIALIFFVGRFLMPELAKSFAIEGWSSSAKSLYSFSTAITNNFFIICSAFFGSIYLFFRSLKTWDGEIRHLIDKHFPYAMYRELQSVSVLMSISNLVGSGQKFTEAIGLINNNAGSHLSYYMNRILSSTRSGDTTGIALENCGLFNTKIATQIAIYYEAGNFEDSLPDLSRITMSIVKRRLQAFSSILSGGTMLTILGLILWVISSVMEISDSIS